MSNEPDNWALACHLQYEQGGAVCIVEHAAGRTSVHAVPVSPRADASSPPPVYLGVAPGRRVWLMDPLSKAVHAADAMPADAAAYYAYPEPGTRRFWYTNDGDEETGNDALNCGDEGASMTVVESSADGGAPRVLRTICVGRGHHVPTFPAADAGRAGVRRRAYVSNLLDGTVSVVGNDPAEAGEYLSVVGLIDLCEPEREKSGQRCGPNNAFPHGQVYSPVSGRIYGLNNGYGTVAVIDPATDRIEARVEFTGCSNLLLSPDGRYVIGKGADRKRDPDHVIGRLLVMDAVSREVVTAADLRDVYPSTYRFNAEGTRLYVTTAATGKGAQKEALVMDRVLVFDAAALPRLEQVGEIEAGMADCGRRPIAFLTRGGATRLVFVPNPSEGTLSIADGVTNRVIETVKVSDAPVEELNFSLLGAENIHGS